MCVLISDERRRQNVAYPSQDVDSPSTSGLRAVGQLSIVQRQDEPFRGFQSIGRCVTPNSLGMRVAGDFCQCRHVSEELDGFALIAAVKPAKVQEKCSFPFAR